jgi:hypothetical protein
MKPCCVVSSALPFFADGFRVRLGAERVYDNTRLTFFVGLYNDEDFYRLRHHGGRSVVVFCGSDAFKLSGRSWWRNGGEWLKKMAKSRRIAVVAISEDIVGALRYLGIENVRYNVCPTMESRFEVTLPKRKKVYVYYNPAHEAIFDWKVYEAIMERFKGTDVEVDDVRSKVFVNPLEMGRVYEECFVGMKPYVKDGYGNTQVELAIAGRRCISNGDFVGNLRYGDADEAIAHIENELAKMDSMEGRFELRELAEKELMLPDGFNTEKFWFL